MYICLWFGVSEEVLYCHGLFGYGFWRGKIIQQIYRLIGLTINTMVHEHDFRIA